ncbi:MAG: hypothetical protein HFG55_07650 [Lachnospiraceae bacterium]|nr:hypothetical protein [Lachnospiraceae bacterium]
MEERLIDILVSAVCAAHYDTKRNDVCRIFIPGDSRMFDKFEKTLRKRMTARWQEFLLEHGTEAARLAGWDWLHRYLRYQDPVADLYGYVQAGSDIWKQRTDEREERAFLRDAVVKASCYGAECGAGILAEEGRLVFSEKRRLTGAEERMILDFYRFVLEGIRETFIEILPKAETSRTEALEKNGYACAQALNNLEQENLDNEELLRYIRYCISRELRDFKEPMVKIAKNGQRKAWVRQAAVEYVCRFMPVGEICDRLLPDLHGKLFYWAVARLASTRDAGLKKQLENYVERYSGQEMKRDICLVKMQEREGVVRIRRYLERRHYAPRKLEYPDMIMALGEIRETELLDELARLTELMMRDSFRDREHNGLLVSLIRALSAIASGGERAYAQVQELLERKEADCLRQYQACMEAATDCEGEAALRKSAQKLAMLLRMREDIRWWLRNCQKRCCPVLPGNASANDTFSPVLVGERR